MSSLNNACDACGWMAAFGGMLAFGSFGVPIKSKVAQSVDIDPLVMQSYKTSMCFLTSWLILLYGEEFHFTPWGIVSGLFWVPGGVATIYAVKNAGLAIGIGVGSSFIVLVSFYWGIFVFGEHVHSIPDACFAIACMMTGLLGMAYYSSPQSTPSSDDSHPDRDQTAMAMVSVTEEATQYQGLVSSGSEDEDAEEPTSFQDEPSQERQEDDLDASDSEDGMIVTSSEVPAEETGGTHVLICGTKWKRRTLGILSAMFTGIYGGSIMAPMKYAPDDAKGLGYLISFAVGAATVNISLWVIRFAYLCQRHRCFTRGYQALPCFHFRKMWLYGGTCGLLWSVGNFFSIIAIDFLGEGVGYSAVQASMLVSGLWGIFYFKEIQGTWTIMKWFCSASVTVVGILLLSYEHHEK